MSVHKLINGATTTYKLSYYSQWQVSLSLSFSLSASPSLPLPSLGLGYAGEGGYGDGINSAANTTEVDIVSGEQDGGMVAI